MKKAIYGIVIFIIVLAAGLLFAANYFAGLMMYPQYNCNPDHYVFCDDPSERGLGFEDVKFKTEDDVTLTGWYIPAEQPSQKAIVVVHGHGGNKNGGLRYAQSLHKEGFNLLLFDLRVHTNTDQAFSSMGYHEKKDVHAAVRFAESRGNEKIGVLAFSLGASTAINAMAENDSIDAGVFNSGYANVSDVLAEVGKADYGLPRWPLIPMVMTVAGLRGDFDADEVNAEDKIALISPRPVFIIHCTGDDYVYFHHGQRLFEAAKDPKQFWAPACEGHVKAWNQFRDETETKVSEFFLANL